eukprot:TRINITY_DN782_c0_g2_i1.p1 TRINITY_DN782_c0_g2~~TRINITY_DN782_c0_g2_i1.p1  ORF type:complete len:378 (+),score=38.15 TRINITY_DN782_c0_g2_i1:133-1266(+)
MKMFMVYITTLFMLLLAWPSHSLNRDQELEQNFRVNQDVYSNSVFDLDSTTTTNSNSDTDSDTSFQSNSSSTCKRILWVMGFSWYEPNLPRINQIKFAIISALKSAPGLQPLIMYETPPETNSNDDPFIQWLEHHNVIVCQLNNTLILRELRSASEIDDHNRANYFCLDVDTYLNQCVRDDNANISREYVLYTDTDVAFVRDINECNIPKPHVLSIGGDIKRNEMVNLGVMVFNVSGYQHHKNAFFEHFHANNYVKELFTEFFASQNLMDKLPELFNFKMYWWCWLKEGKGLKVKPMIIHFDGPELGTPCTKCMLATESENLVDMCGMCPEYHQKMWLALNGATELYAKFNELFERWVFLQPPFYDFDSQSVVFSNK